MQLGVSKRPVRVFRREEICAPPPFNHPLLANYVRGLLLERVDRKRAAEFWRECVRALDAGEL